MKRRAPRPWPEADDALLGAAQCARKVGGMDARNWSGYAARWPVLVAGARVVRVKNPAGRGRMKWLRSAVVRHIREELLHPERAQLQAGGAV